jgi:hypothetical protein
MKPANSTLWQVDESPRTLAFVLGTRRGDPNCGDQGWYSLDHPNVLDYSKTGGNEFDPNCGDQGWYTLILEKLFFFRSLATNLTTQML